MSNQNQNIKTTTSATPEVAEQSRQSEMATGEPTHNPQVQQTGDRGTLDVQLDPGNSDVSKMEHEEITSPLSEGEDDLLKSPQSTGDVDVATEQLNKLRMKRRNPTTAERRAAVIARLEARGETFDPSKWRRGQKTRNKGKTGAGHKATDSPTGSSEDRSGSAKRSRGDQATPPSSEGPAKRVKSAVSIPQTTPKAGTSRQTNVSYRDMSVTKMAIVLQGFPTNKLSTEQGEAIEEAIIDGLRPMEDGSIPSFSGSYMEKGALILSCRTQATTKWLEALVPIIKPLGEETNLVVGPRKDLLKTTRIFFRTHPKLNKREPKAIVEMLDTLNPTFRVKEWNILTPHKDDKGYGFVCFLDEDCFRAVAASNFQANLGIWQVSIVVSTTRDHASSASKPAP